jgi:importin-4
LQKAATNWHPLIKSEVADAFPSLILPSVQAYHDGQVVWKKGDTDGSTTSQLSQHTASIVQAVLTEELLLMKDEDKTTVGKACEAVQSVIEICGPHALAPVVNDALANTHDLLTKNAPCQQADELYGEMPDDDDDHDVFMQAACDLVGAFGRVMGDHLAPYLPQFLPAIVQFAKPSRPASDRSMAVGCLSEIAQELSGPCWHEHWKTCFLPAILQGLQDEDENVNRNAAFLAGIACEQLKEVAGPDYAAILQGLGPILARAPQAQQAIATQQQVPSESALACLDNSAAAVARMIMASPNHVPSLEQVVPVFVRGLPLMVDMTENETVYNCLLGLLNMKHPALELDQVQRVFSLATAPDSKVDDELKVRLAQALQSLSASQ